MINWRGTWAAVDGKLACKTVKTSGDEDVDKIGCFATLTCVKPAYPELKAIADAKAVLQARDPGGHDQDGALGQVLADDHHGPADALLVHPWRQAERVEDVRREGVGGGGQCGGIGHATRR